MIGDLTSAQKVTHSGPCPERMAARLKEAVQVAGAGGKASILTGGDPSIFSSGWRILDQAALPGAHLSRSERFFLCGRKSWRAPG